VVVDELLQQPAARLAGVLLMLDEGLRVDVGFTRLASRPVQALGCSILNHTDRRFIRAKHGVSPSVFYGFGGRRALRQGAHDVRYLRVA
jgi:hypothetical protein